MLLAGGLSAQANDDSSEVEGSDAEALVLESTLPQAETLDEMLQNLNARMQAAMANLREETHPTIIREIIQKIEGEIQTALPAFEREGAQDLLRSLRIFSSIFNAFREDFLELENAKRTNVSTNTEGTEIQIEPTEDNLPGFCGIHLAGVIIATLKELEERFLNAPFQDNDKKPAYFFMDRMNRYLTLYQQFMGTKSETSLQNES